MRSCSCPTICVFLTTCALYRNSKCSLFQVRGCPVGFFGKCHRRAFFVEQFLRISFRAKPVVYAFPRKDEGHSVVEKTDFLRSLPRQDDEHRKAALQTVEAAQPGHGLVLRPNLIFAADPLLSILPANVLPLKIPGGWDDAAVPPPVLPKRGLCRRGLRAGVNKERAPGVAPLHRKDRSPAKAVRREHGNDICRADFARNHDFHRSPAFAGKRCAVPCRRYSRILQRCVTAFAGKRCAVPRFRHALPPSKQRSAVHLLYNLTDFRRVIRPISTAHPPPLPLKQGLFYRPEARLQVGGPEEVYGAEAAFFEK